jgi:hypothetical protein
MNQITDTWYSNHKFNVIQAIKRALPQRLLTSKKHEESVSVPENTPEEKLMYTTVESQETLFKASSRFPYILNRDTIQIDRDKITIAHRSYLRMADIMSVQICDVLSVEMKVGPFFGSLILTSKYFKKNVQTANYLQREDVIRLQRLIQGSIIAHRKNIDYSGIEKEQLIALLTDLGQGTTG